MKVYTLYQPYAGFMAAGVKLIESRGQRTHYRGDLLIHAGKQWMPISPEVERYIKENPWLRPFITPRGAILCKVNLYDCASVSRICCGESIAAEVGRLVLTSESFDTEYGISPLEYMLGYYDMGRFGYLTKDLVTFKEPIPCRGMQGLWNYEGVLPE